MRKKNIAVIDDDPCVISYLRTALTRRMPDAEVFGFVEPVAPAGFDVYVVDREFDGANRGQEVMRRIRAVSPGSLVVAYSGNLDREFLRALLRDGCGGAFDKGDVKEVDDMIDFVELHFSEQRSGSSVFRDLGNTIRAISGLLHEWNLRLANDGRAYAKTSGDR
jgi:DNA-binding NarL/FixJ family response regulator